MKMIKKTLLAPLVAGLMLAFPAGEAAAQPWPSRTIRIVTPYIAGGAADITARIVGQKLSESLGVSVIIENRAGANGMAGTDGVAKAAPDGYTLLMVASGPIVINPALYPKMPYDPVKDLMPIAQATTFQYVLVALPTSPIKSVQTLIEMAKAKPSELTYGSTGIGGGGHLAGELFALMTGTKLTHVPYRGSAAALTDLLGGRLSFTFDTVITSVPLVAEGTLRAYAVTGPRRASAFPDVPTLDELGLKGFEITQWQGLFAPARTDKAIIAKLNEAMNQALRAPDVIERLGTQGGNEIVGGSPEDFARVIQTDLARYGKLIKDANIKMLE